MLIILIAGANIALCMWMASRLNASVRRFAIKKRYTAALEAPSVSVCIPARNETHAMTQCLERVLASDYKKMEVIVYDDGSTDDTSILIKSFAHAGVRFVPGSPLKEGWLGKNHALDVLAREASGTYVIFMDVDTLIAPTSISQLVGYTMTEKASVVSVLPRRNDSWRASAIFGSLRYFWELLLSRKAVPAASSALWLAHRETLLETYGGLALHKKDVSPESSFAVAAGSTYRCLLSSAELAVSYEKKWSSQVETSRRLLYPLLGSSISGVIIAATFLLLLSTPLPLFVGAIIMGTDLAYVLLLAITIAASMLMYSTYVRHVRSGAWLIGSIVWPYVAAQELVLLLISYIAYATGKVTWKGRSITTGQTTTLL